MLADELDNGIRLYLNFLVTLLGMPLKRQLVMVLCMRSRQYGHAALPGVAEEKGLMPKGISKIEEMCRKFGLPVTYENWIKKPFIKP